MAGNQTKDRKWLFSADPQVIQADDGAALHSEIWQVVGLLQRAGGAVSVSTASGTLVIAAMRERADEPGEFYDTPAFVFTWHPAVPAVRGTDPTSVIEPIEMRDEDEAQVAEALAVQ